MGVKIGKLSTYAGKCGQMGSRHIAERSEVVLDRLQDYVIMDSAESFQESAASRPAPQLQLTNKHEKFL